MLFPTPEAPPTYATTIDIPAIAPLAGDSRVVIEPFLEGAAITGPIVLDAVLTECR